MIEIEKRYFIFELTKKGKLKHPVKYKGMDETPNFDRYSGYESEEQALKEIESYLRSESEQPWRVTRTEQGKYFILPEYYVKYTPDPIVPKVKKVVKKRTKKQVLLVENDRFPARCYGG